MENNVGIHGLENAKIETSPFMFATKRSRDQALGIAGRELQTIVLNGSLTALDSTISVSTPKNP